MEDLKNKSYVSRSLKASDTAKNFVESTLQAMRNADNDFLMEERPAVPTPSHQIAEHLETVNSDQHIELYIHMGKIKKASDKEAKQQEKAELMADSEARSREKAVAKAKASLAGGSTHGSQGTQGQQSKTQASNVPGAGRKRKRTRVSIIRSG